MRGLTVTEIVRPKRTHITRNVPSRYKRSDPDTRIASEYIADQFKPLIDEWLAKLEGETLPEFYDIERFRFELARKAIEVSEGNAAEAADILNIKRTTLIMKLKVWEKEYGWVTERNRTSGRNREAHLLRQWKYLGLLS